MKPSLDPQKTWQKFLSWNEPFSIPALHLCRSLAVPPCWPQNKLCEPPWVGTCWDIVQVMGTWHLLILALYSNSSGIWSNMPCKTQFQSQPRVQCQDKQERSTALVIPSDGLVDGSRKLSGRRWSKTKVSFFSLVMGLPLVSANHGHCAG